MTATTSPSPHDAVSVHGPKPPWRYARERRLGKRARALVGSAELQIARCLAVLGAEPVLQATREDSWALACLTRAADCDDASEHQDAWVLLAACRPTPVRRAIFGERIPRSRSTRPQQAAPAVPASTPSPDWRTQLAEIGQQLRAHGA